MACNVRWALVAAGLATLAMAGCKEDEQPIEPATEDMAPSGAAAADEAPGKEPSAAPSDAFNIPAEDDAPVGPAAATDAYEVRAEPAGAYKAGELGRFDVVITGKGEYHVNQEFPTLVGVSAKDLQLPRVTLAHREDGQNDAAEFTEKKARFEVPFTAAEAGKHEAQVDVEFAVCLDEACMPHHRKLAVVLPVEQ